MTNRSVGISVGLTLLGALPFYGFLLIPGTLSDILHTDVQNGFRTYGAVIASFMAGAIWGTSQRETQAPVGALLFSNVLALAAWGSLFISQSALEAWLVLQFLIFCALLGADVALWRSGRLADWYIRLRGIVTLAVLLAYGLAYFKW